MATLDLVAPPAGELVLRIDAAAVCHSDLSVVNGDPVRPMPMALNHEAVATVVATGSEHSEFFGGRPRRSRVPPGVWAVRRRVSGAGYRCPIAAAANGRGELIDGGCRLSDDGALVHHLLGVSASASYAVVDERSAVKVDADAPVQVAVLFGCAVTGGGAVVNSMAVRRRESVVVYGLGRVGLAAVLAAVIAVDPVAHKREITRANGVTAAHIPMRATRIPRLVSGGPDVAIETAGRASVLAEVYRVTRCGGRTVTVSLPDPAELLTFPAVRLLNADKTIIGSYKGSAIPRRDIPRYVALWRAGRLPVERLLTAARPLAGINAALDDLARGYAIRQVVLDHAA